MIKNKEISKELLATLNLLLDVRVNQITDSTGLVSTRISGEDLVKVIPSIVDVNSKESFEPYTIKDNQLIYFLVKAVQELNTKVETLYQVNNSLLSRDNKNRKVIEIVNLPQIGTRSTEKLAGAGIITLTDFVERFEEVCKITGYTTVQLAPALEIAKANIQN